VGHIALMGDMKNSYKTLIKNPEWMMPHWRPRCAREDYIKRILEKVWTEFIGIRTGFSGGLL
jgi:hypothetical protein